MSLLRHFVYASIYGALAVAVALTLPYSVPGMGAWTAVAIGAAVFLFGTLLHESDTRQRRDQVLRDSLDELADLTETMVDDLSRAREEIRAIRGRLSERPDTQRSMEEVRTELRMLQELVGHLTESQGQADTDASGSVRTLPKVLPTDGICEAQLLALVRDAVRYDRIDLALHPIVSLPQRKLRHYQTVSRIRTSDGAHLLPNQYESLAVREGMAATIDNIRLFRCVQLVREALRRHRSVGFFASLSRESLNDRGFIDQFVEFMTANEELSSRLVFAFRHDDVMEAMPTFRQPLERLAGLGFRFSLDGLRRLDRLDHEFLHSCSVRYLRVDTAILIDAVHGRGIDMRDFKSELDRLAIDLIADGIDDEDVLLDILDLDIDYGQGLLFAESRRG